MPQPITTTQLVNLQKSIESGGVGAAIQAYGSLYAQGYNYAGWAQGVAAGDSISGQAALSYLKGTALMGLGGEQCRNLTQQQIDQIRTDMAIQTLKAYQGIADKTNEVLTRDLTYEETKNIHKQVFKDNQLSLDNWTLNIPMELIRQRYGDQAVETLWQQLRDTGGNGVNAVIVNSTLLAFMEGARNSENPDVQRKAELWLDQFKDTSIWLDIVSNTLGENFRNTLKPISDIIGTTPDPLVKTIQYVDPLILDLDGDGLEITPLSKGVLFDANGDSIKTGTAWASADDGMLVWDKNGNGRIDSGQELFGDETILANGQKATQGFAALSDLDTGSFINGVVVGAGDGVFDAKDAQFANLRIWQDLNQDGISQANELKTLATTGVTSVKLGSSATNANYGDAILAHSSTFTRLDGSTGQAGSFILAQNNFVRQFNPIAINDAAKALPDLQGSGWVRNLREAATLSPELMGLLNQAKNATTRAKYHDAVAGLLREWGNDSAYNSASKQALKAGYGLILSDPVGAQEAGWMGKAIKASDAERNAYRGTLSATDLAKFDAMRERMVGGLEKIQAYEAFTGHTFLNWPQVQGDAINYTPRFVSNGRVPVEVSVPLSRIIYENRNGFMSTQAGYIRVDIPAPPNSMPHVETLWNRLVDDATNNLMPALRLSKYFDMVDLNFDKTGITHNFSRLNAAVAAVSAANAHEGAALLLDLYHVYGTGLEGLGWNGKDQIRSLMQQAITSADVRSAFNVMGFSLFSAGVTAGTEGQDVFAGDATENTFNAGSDDDIIDGQAGNDNLSGGMGDDLIFGGAGNDTLNGNNGADTLDGGAGNDTLIGELGNNVYLFGKGDGQDFIKSSSYDSTAGRLSTLQLKAGVATSDVVIKQVYDSDFGGNRALEVSIAGTTDKITLNGFFYADDTASGYNSVQQIKFADGTVWNIATLQNKIFAGTAGNDTIRATIEADVLNGGAGDDNLNGAAGNDTINGDDGSDTLTGEAGADTLNGGAGNDFFDGGAGNDILDGGTGNDQLYGGVGNDTYLFGKGDGQDVIVPDGDADPGKFNVLQFKAGITPSQILAKRAGTDLVLSIAGTTDQVIVGYFFYGDDTANFYNSIQQVKFADGTTWDINSLKNKSLAGTAGNDTIRATIEADVLNGGAGDDNLNGAAGNDTINGDDGSDTLTGEAGADTLNGGAGNDFFDGGAGNDTLDGGTGNDQLYGGVGNDTYLFGKGDGQDVIVPDGDADPGKFNVLQFKAGITPSQILAKRAGTDLVLSIAGTTDQVIVGYFFYGDDTANFYNSIQQVKFADGTTWDINSLKNKIFAGTAAADNIIGTTVADTLNGQAGTDTLYGRDGNDTLYGGADNDTLNGENGNDTLDGGTGNDQLYGGAGNDTYLFGKGDGQDVIVPDGDAEAGKLNVLQFKTGVAPSQILAKRAGTDLVLSIAGTTDQVTIGYFFYGDDTANYYNSIQQVKFADGTTWDINSLKNKIFAGTAAADNIIGTTVADTLTGQAGTDTLYGRDGNDTLYGGADNDTLNGENGNDTLDGGTGNDQLYGGAGNDTYLFGKGDGQDVIVPDGDAEAGKLNILQFKTGVAPSQILARRAGTDLVLSIAGTTDQVTIGYFFYGDDTANYYNSIQQVKFADGTTWDINSLKNKIFAGTAAADNIIGTTVADTLNGQAGTDTLYGRDGNDTLYGGADNDTLNGENGNDTLDGGTGNDQLYGGAGNDTYLFGKGDGQDVIVPDGDAEAGKLVRIQPPHAQNWRSAGSGTMRLMN